MRRRWLGVAVAVVLAAGWVMAAGADRAQATVSMHELMVQIVQPNSDAVFYISRTPPQDDADWRRLQQQTLMLAESANLLLMPGYLVPGEQWLQDSLLMRDASVTAYRAAIDQDLQTLIDLNNDLYTSCESCHNATR